VLGAGASLANALHFRARRMPQSRPPLDGTFFQTVRARGINLSAPLRNYFTNVLQIDPDGDEMPRLRMEEVFKDVFFDFQDAPSNTVALNAYIDLVDLYLVVLRQTTNWLNTANRRGAPIGRLLADAASRDDDLSVVTFNHDLVIENEIERRSALSARWCIDQGYGRIGAAMPAWIPARAQAVFQRHSDGRCDHSRPITVLKLHGSLKWVVRLQGARPTASFLSGRSNRPMNLVVRRQITGNTSLTRTSGGRGRSTWQTWPVVVPPVYAKEALRSVVHV